MGLISRKSFLQSPQMELKSAINFNLGAFKNMNQTKTDIDGNVFRPAFAVQKITCNGKIIAKLALKEQEKTPREILSEYYEFNRHCD